MATAIALLLLMISYGPDEPVKARFVALGLIAAIFDFWFLMRFLSELVEAKTNGGGS